MGVKKAIGGVFTGTILSGEAMRRVWPYLLGLAVLLVFYIAHTFYLRDLHLERQTLERRVSELEIAAVHSTAARVRQTRRSEIVKRLEEKGIPLREFPHPLKTIERE